MNARTDFQIILGKDGKPAFVVLPYEDFKKMGSASSLSTVPNRVVNLSFDKDLTPMAAWREHLGLTQADVATRMTISQSAYAQMERVKNPRKSTLEKVGKALGLSLDQHHW